MSDSNRLGSCFGIFNKSPSWFAFVFKFPLLIVNPMNTAHY